MNTREIKRARREAAVEEEGAVGELAEFALKA